ncbi:hypothetical protein [uncultured Sulfitobacter sp.]|uniref:hypothetical protein n=1 Tax=uncultured Sulfitobacter sp. TaxID=191468 RepID=UPI002631B1E0|nr:hypothetical protein [uncultured Sulfitobacter sp.]
MGIRTTLYSVDRDAVVSFIEAEDTDFDLQDPTELDRAVPVLSYLIGADAGRRPLYCSECLDLGDAALRGFMPEDAAMFLRRMQDCPPSERLAEVDWQSEIVGKISPFADGDTKEDGIRYIGPYAEVFESGLERLVAQGRGMITVEA